MAKLNLTEVLCQYAETHGLNPTKGGKLYLQLEDMANECIDTIDLLAYQEQNPPLPFDPSKKYGGDGSVPF